MMKVILVYLVGCLYCASLILANDQQSGMVLSAKLDKGCIDLKQHGPCPTPKYPYVGVRISYWEPTYIIETVNMTGDYVMVETGAIIGPMAKQSAQQQAAMFFDQQDIPVDSAGGHQSLSGTNLQFNEVHVLQYPLKELIQAVLCPNLMDNAFAVQYISELDFRLWRKVKENIGIQQRLGTWGMLYPRQGFSVHASALVASALNAIRAVDIIANPLPGHVVLASPRIVNEYARDRLQMVYPDVTTCLTIGENLMAYDQSYEQKAKYVWIYWHYRECCRTVSG